jgi:hypothetical protein
METVWSDDSSNFAIVLNSRWETEEIFLVNSKPARVKDIKDKVLNAFKQVLRREGGSGYNVMLRTMLMLLIVPGF